jgi:hypothetical protein
VRFLVLMISSTSSLVISLTGRSPHAAMNTERRSRSGGVEEVRELVP